MNKVKIKEIFASIQGEGPYIGYKQLFIRFCGCNLKCKYCDTDFKSDEKCKDYDVQSLLDEVNKFNDIHSVSLTGGEPLLNSEFLAEFLPKVNKKIYLETNATLVENFLKIKPFIDTVSADIKLESATGINTFEMHKNFFAHCDNVETFAKIVFNSNITQEEIKKCTELGKLYNIELILQPEMNGNTPTVTSDFEQQILDKFLSEYDKVRLIPQVHKFLNVR